MVIIHDSDKYKYFDKQRRVEIIKYSNGVKKIYEGKAIYSLRRIYDGENVFSDIFNFIAKNKDTISNVASVTSSVSDSVGKIASNAIDVERKIKELRHKPSINNDAINKVLTASDTPKTGNGFFYVQHSSG